MQGIDKKLIKKARRKYLANGIKNKLSNIIDSPLIISYKKSFFCSKTLVQQGQKITSLYCNQRWCPTCTAIKTAKFIDAYKHELEAYNDYFFVTLTVKSDKIFSSDIKPTITAMNKAWNKINGNARIRKFRRELDVWHGMKKVECTYRQNGTFHPHFHILVRGESQANWIVSEWIRLNPTSLIKSQNITKADKGIQNELFKYYTKLISGSSKGSQRSIDAVALDSVLVAMIGKQVFKTFGTFRRLLNEEELPELSSQSFDIEETELKNWKWLKNDWIDYETGEVLSGYNPSDSFQKLLYSEGKKSSDNAELFYSP